MDPDGNNNFNDLGTSSLQSVPYALHAKSADNIDDADADPTNEIQMLELSGTTISLSNGNSIDLAPIIPPGGTDDQNLLLNGTQLGIEDGNSVDLSVLQDGVDDADNDPTNEHQSLDLNGTTISITDGNSVDLAPIIPPGGTDDQTLTLAGTDLSIEDGNSVDLSVLQDGVDDADNDPTNEHQSLDLNGTTISITDGNAVDLAPIIPPGGTDDQTLTLAGTDLSIEDGNSVDLSVLQDGVDDADNDPTNENQDLSLNGTDLSIENGNSVDLSVLQDGVDDADNDPTNENQDLSLNGTDLSIENGNSVDLSVLQDGVDDADNDPTNEFQNLGLLGGNILTITDGNNVALPPDEDWTKVGNTIYNISDNIGIGLTNPNPFVPLHISHPSQQVILEGNVAKLILDGGDRAMVEGNILGTPSGSLQFRSNGNLELYPADLFDPAVTVESNSGFVGIGTSNPAFITDIVGTGGPRLRVFSQDDSFAGMIAKNDNHEYFVGVQADFEAADGTNSGFHIYDNTVGARRMVITANGKVGINDSNPGIFGLSLIHGDGGGLRLKHSAGSSDFWELWHGNSAGNDDLFLINDSGFAVGRFNYSTGAYTALSDEAAKSNIENIQMVLPALMKLKARSYTYKSDLTNQKSLGFLAQEVEEIFPELVAKPLGSSTKSPYYTLNYAGFGVIAVKAIQEQQTIIDKQQDIIEAQQDKIQVIKEELDQIKSALIKAGISLD